MVALKAMKDLLIALLAETPGRRARNRYPVTGGTYGRPEGWTGVPR